MPYSYRQNSACNGKPDIFSWNASRLWCPSGVGSWTHSLFLTHNSTWPNNWKNRSHVMIMYTCMSEAICWWHWTVYKFQTGPFLCSRCCPGEEIKAWMTSNKLKVNWMQKTRLRQSFVAQSPGIVRFLWTPFMSGHSQIFLSSTVIQKSWPAHGQ